MKFKLTLTSNLIHLCLLLSWASIDENSKFLPKTFETCEPAVFIKTAYPSVLTDFEDEVSAKLRAKKKPAGTRRATKKVEPETTEQPAITQFFTQNKVSTKRAEPKAKPAEITSKKASGSDTNYLVTKSDVGAFGKYEPILEEDDEYSEENDPVSTKSESRGCVPKPKAVPKSKASTKRDHIPSKVSLTKEPPLITKAPGKIKLDAAKEAPKTEASSKNLLLSRVAFTGGAPSPIAVHKNVLRLQQDSLADMSVDPSDDSCVSDLSMIIDDFMSKRVQDLKLDTKVSAPPLVTSTPRGQVQRVSIVKAGRVASAETNAVNAVRVPTVPVTDVSMRSVNDSFEDSFDRMCK